MAVEAGPPDALRAAEVEHLRGQIALDQRRGSDAARLLLSAARRLEPLDPGLARETHLEALGRPRCGPATWTTPVAVLEAAEAARAAPPGPGPPRAVDVLLDALALRLTRDTRRPRRRWPERWNWSSRRTSPTDEADRWLWLASVQDQPASSRVELWDFESWHALAARQARFARDAGALVHLQFALNYLAWTHLLAGELTAAAQMIEEDHLIAEATGNPPVADTEMMLAAWRGREAAASELIEATRAEATARGLGRLVRLRGLRERGAATTASAATTPRATPPGGRSSATSWARAPGGLRAGRGSGQDR